MNLWNYVDPPPSGYNSLVTTPWDLIDSVLEDCPNAKVSIPENLDLNEPISIYPVSWDIKFGEIEDQ